MVPGRTPVALLVPTLRTVNAPRSTCELPGAVASAISLAPSAARVGPDCSSVTLTQSGPLVALVLEIGKRAVYVPFGRSERESERLTLALLPASMVATKRF